MATTEAPPETERPDRPSSPIDANEAGVESAQNGLKSVIQDAQVLSAVDGAAVTRAVINIAAAVMNISTSLRRPPHIRDVDISWRPNIKRHTMTEWAPAVNDPSDWRDESRDMINVFYTKVPKSIEGVSQEQTSQDAFKVAYSKAKWSEGPQRILLQSDEMLQELLQATERTQRSTVKMFKMIPPFKLLIHNRHAILRKVEELNQQANTEGEVAPPPSIDESHGALSGTDEDSSNIPDGAFKRLHTKINGMRSIQRLLHTDLANYIGLDERARSGELEEVLFEEVYHLFKPGDLILSAEHGDTQLYQVYSVTGGRMRLSSPNPGPVPGPRYNVASAPYRLGATAGTWTDLVVNSFMMAWDGENIGPLQVDHQISYFAGTRKVIDLDVFPIQFHKNAESLRQVLRARGQRVVSCSGHKQYTGASVATPRELIHFGMGGGRYNSGYSNHSPDNEEEMDKLLSIDMVRGDIFVDYKPSYRNSFAINPSLSNLKRTPSEDAEEVESLNDDTHNYGDQSVDIRLSDEFLSQHRRLTAIGKPRGGVEVDGDRLQLLSSQIPGFIFSSRQWRWLNIDNIEDIDKSREARHSGWTELVIPERFSDLLLSVVNNHISGIHNRQWESSARQGPNVQMDLVRGKGRGLIVLLHGPPGSGKTSTAETIAAYTGRPLYAITCGDLGTEPEDLERNLVRHSRLAERWGCVLLLDEADVFLMSRSYDDLYRNAMVSVFLRQLEYYSGILFLTTNIVGVIDEAFKSRIHIALEYPAIDEKSTLEIWRNLLQRITRDGEKSEVKIRFDERNLLKFAKQHYQQHSRSGTTWNGRQIRNAFQTAISIGQYERLKKIDEAEARGEEPDRSTRHIRLSVDSFKAVAETANDFEKYITKTRGDDRERAAMHQFRKYEHSREPPQRKRYPTRESTYQTNAEGGPSRLGRSTKKADRDYYDESDSSARLRASKGKEGAKKRGLARRDEDESRGHSRPSLHHSDDDLSNEDIIEEDLESEED